jgi:hypothetical protein
LKSKFANLFDDTSLLKTKSTAKNYYSCQATTSCFGSLQEALPLAAALYFARLCTVSTRVQKGRCQLSVNISEFTLITDKANT